MATAPKTLLNPLNWQMPLVDSQGMPTLEFQKKWAQQFHINGSIPDLSTAAAVSAVLDVLYMTPGGILVRGPTLWEGLASPADPTKFLQGTDPPGWAAPVVTEAQINLSDVVTDDVSIVKHGFAPKAPNDATKFLDGTGAYSVPSGGGGGASDRFAYERAAGAFHPDYTTFTLSGGAGITFTNGTYGFSFNVGAAASTAWMYKATPASQKFDAIAKMVGVSKEQNFPVFGIFITSAALGKQVALYYDMRAGLATYISKYTVLGFTADYVASNFVAPFTWFRISCDGTNLFFYISVDGVIWAGVFATTLADFIGSVSHAGFFFGSGASFPFGGQALHFEIVDNT